MKAKSKQLSPAIQLMDLVWEKSFKHVHFSYRKLNESLQILLKLAISSGFDFERDDFQYIAATYRFGYWGGNDGHMMGEQYYAIAIRDGNMQAVQSFEAWTNRKPFIFRDVKCKLFMDTPRKECRLFVRSEFQWKSEKGKVTSFEKDGKHLVACSYKEKAKDDYSREKIKHQYKITNSDLQKEMRWLKKCDILEKSNHRYSMYHAWLIDLFYVTVPEPKQSTDLFFRMTIKI